MISVKIHFLTVVLLINVRKVTKMKIVRHVVYLLVIFYLVLSCSIVQADDTPKKFLKYNSDGTFKILQVSNQYFFHGV